MKTLIPLCIYPPFLLTGEKWTLGASPFRKSQRSPVFLLSFFLCLTSSLTLPQVAKSTPIVQAQTTSTDWVQQGKILYQNGQFAQAVTTWQRAAQAFAAQGDRLNQAMALSNLSLSAQQLGVWDQATQSITESLTLLQQQSSTPAQQKILAASLDIQGQLQLSTNHPDSALETWKKAANLHLKLGNHNGAIASQINQSQALQDLGLYPRACQTVLDALGFDQNGCAISASAISASALQTLNTQQQSVPLQILGLRSLGNILRIIGQPKQSQLVLQKAWELAQPAADPQTQAAIALSLGNTARALGSKYHTRDPQGHAPQPLQAIANCRSSSSPKTESAVYSQAAACYREAAIGPAPIAIQAQLNLLHLFIQTQQWDQVAEVIAAVQTKLASLPASPVTAAARLKLAQNLMCLQTGVNPSPTNAASPILQSCPFAQSNVQPQAKTSLQAANIPPWLEIRSMIDAALQQSQTLGDRKTAANALGYLAALAQQTGQWSEAQQLTEQALQQISAFNEPELTYLWQWQLGRLFRHQGKTNQAIAAYTSTFEILQSLRRDLVATDPDLQFTFRDRVEPVYREFVDLLLTATAPSQANLQQARNVIESLQLAELNNFFREACIEAHPQPIDHLDPKAGVIYGIVLPDRLAVILSLPGEPLRYAATELSSPATPGAGKAVEQTVGDLFATLNPFISVPHPLQPNQKLYNWLVRPLEADLDRRQVQTLVFVLDSGLRGIPVAALHDGQQYLVEKYSLALTPGLQLLSSRSLAPEKFKILAGGLAEARQGFSALPGVQLELQQIAKAAPTNSILNADFTSPRLQTELDAAPFPVIHLATHAQFSSQAENTFLLTWNERINVKDLDQFLRKRDRRGRNPIELLILSACQTALGDNRAALGLAGLAVRSGARSTLATLWSVQDESTADLMGKFYGQLNQTTSVSKADALRQAQLSLLKSPQYQHPFYWAPFVLVGNWL